MNQLLRDARLEDKVIVISAGVSDFARLGVVNDDLMKEARIRRIDVKTIKENTILLILFTSSPPAMWRNNTIGFIYGPRIHSLVSGRMNSPLFDGGVNKYQYC